MRWAWKYVAIFTLALVINGCSCSRPTSTPPTPPSRPPDARSATPAEPTTGLTREAHDQSLPGPPGTVDVVHDGDRHVVEWNGTRDDTIRGYQVYRRRATEAWEAVQFVELRADDARNRGRYKFEERLAGQPDYTIAAVGANGRPGPKTVEIH